MKTRILLLLFASLDLICYGQIGINTEYPLGVFHIDSNSDNGDANSPTNIGDDIIITSDGNLGLAVLNPKEKLEVGGTSLFQGKVTVNDGTQKESRVFLTDGTGTGRWGEMQSMKKVIINYKLGTLASNLHDGSERPYMMSSDANMQLSGDIADLEFSKTGFTTALGSIDNGFTLKKGSYLMMVSSNINSKKRGAATAEYGVLSIYSSKKQDKVYETYYIGALWGHYFYIDTEGDDNYYLTYKAIDPGIKDNSGNSFFLSPPYQSKDDIAQVVVIQLKN